MSGISPDLFREFLQNDQILHKEADLLTYEADAVTWESLSDALYRLRERLRANITPELYAFQ
jgi:hypothetical protein